MTRTLTLSKVARSGNPLSWRRPASDKCAWENRDILCQRALRRPPQHHRNISQAPIPCGLICQASKMARQFHFVTVSNPTHALSSKSRKSAYSHAFRQAHAQRRLKQVETHRQETATVPTINTVCVAPEEGISSLLSRVPLDSNKDPFSSLARPLSSAEYFLLNHCTPLSKVIPNFR